MVWISDDFAKRVQQRLDRQRAERRQQRAVASRGFQRLKDAGSFATRSAREEGARTSPQFTDRYLSALRDRSPRAAESLAEQLVRRNDPRTRGLATGRGFRDELSQLPGDIGSGLFTLNPFLSERARGSLPRPLRFAAENVGVADIATAGLGGLAAQGLRRGPRAARLAAPFVEPIVGGGPGRRLAAEAGVSIAAGAAAQGAAQTLPEDTPAPLRFAGTLGAGLLGGVAASGVASRSLGRAPAVQALQAAPDDETFETARGALLRAVREEETLRRVGTAHREIAEGRRAQAGGIGRAFEQAAGEGLSGEDLVQAARQGAATGPLRRTTAELNISDAQRGALFDELGRQFSAGQVQPFEFMRASTAMSRLLSGQGLQPAEIKALRTILGEEIADAAARRNAALPEHLKMRAQDTERARDAARQQLDRQAERARRQAETELQRANRLAADEAELRDIRDLRGAGQREQLERIGPSLSPRVEQSRTRAIAALNRADEMEIGRARRYTQQQEQSALRAQVQAQQRQNQIAVRLQEAFDTRFPNSAQVLEKAEARLGEIPGVSETLNREALASIRHWSEGNRILLDGLNASPEGAERVIRAVQSTLAGDLSSSYTTSLVHRRGMLESALVHTGVDPADARRISKMAVEYELNIRYGNAPPPEVLNAVVPESGALPRGTRSQTSAAPAEIVEDLRSTSPQASSAGRMTTGIAELSQEFKNTMFGLDLGVFGQQILRAVNQGGIAAVAGLVNNTLAALHLPHVRLLYSDLALNKQLQYQLDGVAQSARTGVVGYVEDEGTLVRFIPWLGPRVDPQLSQFIGALTEFQFGTVLTAMRNRIHEGNLVMLHLAGRDISDPRVRAIAADNANALTSFAPQAARGTRREVERAVLLSPSMRRAQANTLLQMTKLVRPTATADERILAAMTVGTTAVSILVVGKALNDLVGVDEFVMNPAEKGFGNITLPTGTVINIFPQEQVLKAVARSFGAIAEGDPNAAGRAWAELGLGSLSPALRIGAAAAGFGFQPGRGYVLGDMSLPPGKRALNLAPLPPVLQNMLVEGEGPAFPRTVLELAGFNTYDESGNAMARRVFRDETGRDIFDRTETPDDERRQFLQDHPEIQQRIDSDRQRRAGLGDPGSQRTVLSDEIKDEFLAEQEADDKLLRSGEITKREWRIARSDRAQRREAALDTVYRDQPPREPKNALDRYYIERERLIAENNGRMNDEARTQLDAWIAGLGAADRKYVNDNLGGGELTGEQKKYFKLLDEMDETRYFERDEVMWRRMQETVPPEFAFVRNFDSYGEWREAGIRQLEGIYVEQGGLPGLARQEAEKEFDRHPVAKEWKRYRKVYERDWMAANPDLAVQAVDYDLLSTDSDETEFLEGAASR